MGEMEGRSRGDRYDAMVERSPKPSPTPDPNLHPNLHAHPHHRPNSNPTPSPEPGDRRTLTLTLNPNQETGVLCEHVYVGLPWERPTAMGCCYFHARDVRPAHSNLQPTG